MFLKSYFWVLQCVTRLIGCVTYYLASYLWSAAKDLANFGINKWPDFALYATF